MLQTEPETTTEQTLPIIARCTACSRGFIRLGSRGDMIDHYPAVGTKIPPYRPGVRNVLPECGGKIVLVQKNEGPEAEASGRPVVTD